MGLFDAFKQKKNKIDFELVLSGYFLSETSKILGCEINSDQFHTECKKAAEIIPLILLPQLDKDIQQKTVDTLSSVCKENLNNVYGQYILLLCFRYRLAQKAVIEGRLKAEEVTLNILANSLHKQIEKLIKQL